MTMTMNGRKRHEWQKKIHLIFRGNFLFLSLLWIHQRERARERERRI
jgi:hypothetical protein